MDHFEQDKLLNYLRVTNFFALSRVNGLPDVVIGVFDAEVRRLGLILIQINPLEVALNAQRLKREK